MKLTPAQRTLLSALESAHRRNNGIIARKNLDERVLPSLINKGLVKQGEAHWPSPHPRQRIVRVTDKGLAASTL